MSLHGLLNDILPEVFQSRDKKTWQKGGDGDV